MKIRQLSERTGQSGGGAPRQAEIMGQPHMLAYINEAERQMLKRAGGAEAPGPEGIPAYWKWNEPSSWFDGNPFGTTDADFPKNANPMSATSNKLAAAAKEAADSMLGTGTMNIGGKQLPAEPFNAGNPAIINNVGWNKVKDPISKPLMDAFGFTQRELVGGLDPNQPASMATNEDGSLYQPTDNPVNIANTIGLSNFLNSGDDDSGFVNIISDDNSDSVTYTDNTGVLIEGPTGPINTINEDGEYVAVIDVPEYDPEVPIVEDPPEIEDDPPEVEVVPPINQALIDARARRDAALSSQMGNLSSAFGFGTDDYYTGLGSSYRDSGLSEAFTTAYDDATRGIYDTFKSAGMLTQQGVDDSMGLLAGAEGGEKGRIDSIVDQYTNANRNYVTGGQSSLTSELQGLSSATDDIGALDAQTAQITGFDVNGRVQPYKTPKEQEVVDFFTDFVKRSYDPTYNVDPSAVASGGPKRVSNSVDKRGAGTQPSTIAGILDPVAGGSVKVIG